MMGNQKDKNCIDALIWIGGTYSKVDDFVKEAQLRGCCRQLPFIPVWMKPGKTKIFLAHRDIHKTKKRGSIFGYFVLQRIEVITKDEIIQSLQHRRNVDNLWPRNLNDYVSCIDEWEKQGYSESEIRMKLKERLQYKHLKEIANGKTSSKPSGKESDEWIMDLIEDVLEDLLNICLPDFGDDDEDYDIIDFISDILDILFCNYPEPPLRGEGHRMCSLRKGRGAVYALDALCAAIHSYYRYLLPKYLVSESERFGKSQKDVLNKIHLDNMKAWKNWQEYRKNNEWGAQKLLDYYKGPFSEAVKIVFDNWELKHPIDKRLREKAENFGELIVFKKPFPIIEKTPQVAFRGLCQIDGDRLIDQIANRNSQKDLVVKLIYCGKGEFRDEEPIKTKAQLVSYLSQELNLNKAYARRYIDTISYKAEEQLKYFGYFKLPGICTIRLKGTTGSKIDFYPHKGIPGKVKFYPYKNILDISIIPLSGKKIKKITRKSDFVSCLSKEVPITKTFAANFLSLLAMTARGQLKKFGMFRLPGIGTIRT